MNVPTTYKSVIDVAHVCNVTSVPKFTNNKKGTYLNPKIIHNTYSAY